MQTEHAFQHHEVPKFNAAKVLREVMELPWEEVTRRLASLNYLQLHQVRDETEARYERRREAVQKLRGTFCAGVHTLMNYIGYTTSYDYPTHSRLSAKMRRLQTIHHRTDVLMAF